ncbi:MAG TPA: CoA transferase, partial [Alphaproteobacteria bacterium]|nr:CoA transferase [Alphaproteobacteria bacterium]
FRVVDISNVFSLPYAGGLLADLGAEVIKIEGPARLDTTRGGNVSTIYANNEPGEDPWNRTAGFNLLNRGKKSLTLDLRQPAGREILRDLIKVSDILAENFTPRVMRGWGLDYPNAAKLNPNLIMLSCSGYGQEGPYAQYPGQATTMEATHGLTHVTGYPGDVPSKAGQSFVDFLASWALLMGTTLAVRYRNRFGRGLWVDVAMYQLGCSMVSDAILDWEANGRLGERIGNRHPWLAPQGCYRCAGDDEWCVVSVHDDVEWAALCRAIGRPELADDPRYADNAWRMRNHDEIDAIIAAWTAGVAKFDAMHRLQAAGVRAGAVFNARDMHLDPHAKARGMLERVRFPPERAMGERIIIGRPWRLSGLPLAVRGPGPTLGQHNREVIQGLLGYDDARYAELEQAGIVGTQPTVMRPVVRMAMDERVRRGRLASWDPDYKERLGIGETDAPSG